jgi:ribosomal protein L37E
MPARSRARHPRSRPPTVPEAIVSLFKRQKSTGTPCPRCSQLVPEESHDVCPMCGWDVREAYQGPAVSPHGRSAATESAADPRVA